MKADTVQPVHPSLNEKGLEPSKEALSGWQQGWEEIKQSEDPSKALLESQREVISSPGGFSEVSVCQQ